MSGADFFATLPPWFLLSLALGGLLGAAYKGLYPKSPPGLLTTTVIWAACLAFGHLLALVGDLPDWRLGDLRPLAGITMGAALLCVAKRQRVC